MHGTSVFGHSQFSGASIVWCDVVVIHGRASYLIMVELFASGAFYSCNCSGITISWQSRGRGRAQRGPRPLAWYELGCIRFQLITRGAFRFHSRPGLQVWGSLERRISVFLFLSLFVVSSAALFLVLERVSGLFWVHFRVILKSNLSLFFHKLLF